MRAHLITVSIGLLIFSSACNGSATTSAAPQSPIVPAATVYSWMAPRALQTKSLLYVSSTSSNEVQIYNYKDGVVGTLFGQISIRQPDGLCVDKSGDVWVTSKYAVTEYPHGSATPLRELPGEHATPYACAIDPTSGNPAVSYNRSISLVVSQK